MKRIKSVLLIGLLLLTTHLLAATASPAVMMRQMSSQAIAELKQAKATLQPNQKVPVAIVHRIINEVLLPHIDLDEMSRAVLGRTTWQTATKTQQAQFKMQFTNLVINTYASALATFDKNEIKFYRIRGGYEGQSTVQVNSTVNAPGAPPLPVVYHLENKNGVWLIYDFSVDGISLVESYKAQFSAMVQQKGLDGLIQTLASHNDALAKKQKGNS